MKGSIRILLPLLILASLLAFTLALAPLVTGSAHTTVNNSAQPQAPTPTPTRADASEPGSTDGLVIMSFAIAAIISLPLMLQRSVWTK